MTLVVIHAFPLDHRMWLPVASRVEDAGLSVQVVDLPGFGGTPLPQGPPDLGVVAREILRAIPPGSVIAGVSLGGYVLMELLRQVRSSPVGEDDRMRIHGIALCDTKASADSPEAISARHAMATAAEADPEGCGDLLRERLLPGLLGSDPSPSVVMQVGSWLDEAPAASVAWYQRAMSARPDSHDVLRWFTGPSMVLWGEQDALSPQREQESMINALADPVAACIVDSGHLACVEQPERTASALVDWIRLRGID